jgi:hypothetical protein
MMKRLSVVSGLWEEVEVEVDHEGNLLNDEELEVSLMYKLGERDFDINGMWHVKDGVDGARNMHDGDDGIDTGSVFGGGSRCESGSCGV